SAARRARPLAHDRFAGGPHPRPAAAGTDGRRRPRHGTGAGAGPAHGSDPRGTRLRRRNDRGVAQGAGDLMAVKQGWTGRVFEDFSVGDVYEHPLGRTLLAADNVWFTCLTMNTNPIRFDAVYAAQTEFKKPLMN